MSISGQSTGNQPTTVVMAWIRKTIIHGVQYNTFPLLSIHFGTVDIAEAVFVPSGPNSAGDMTPGPIIGWNERQVKSRATPTQ
jgi:hypothetical protein